MGPAAPSRDRGEVEARVAEFTTYWLGPSALAPPTFRDPTARAQSGPVAGDVRWVEVENEPWNRWNGYGSRLLNGRQVLAFRARLEGPGDLQWIAARTTLEINTRGAPIPAVQRPDDLLTPLMVGAMEQQRFGLEGDLAERMRAAGPFRAAYFPMRRQLGALEGVVAFVLPDPEVQVVAARLVMNVLDDGVARELVWEIE